MYMCFVQAPRGDWNIHQRAGIEFNRWAGTSIVVVHHREIVINSLTKFTVHRTGLHLKITDRLCFKTVSLSFRFTMITQGISRSTVGQPSVNLLQCYKCSWPEIIHTKPTSECTTWNSMIGYKTFYRNWEGLVLPRRLNMRWEMLLLILKCSECSENVYHFQIYANCFEGELYRCITWYFVKTVGPQTDSAPPTTRRRDI